MFNTDKIANVKFTRRGKGYDTAEVDAFLDEIANEIIADQEKISEREAELDEAQKGIVKALLTAQSAAQKIEEDARRKADAMLCEAKASCDNMIADAENTHRTLTDKISDMKAFTDFYRNTIIKEMQSQIDKFKDNFGASNEIINDFENNKKAQFEIAETDEQETEEIPAEEKPKAELITDSIPSINLGDIISGLPQSDTELKALIDEIM